MAIDSLEGNSEDALARANLVSNSIASVARGLTEPLAMSGKELLALRPCWSYRARERERD
jgi:hypothetical protein